MIKQLTEGAWRNRVYASGPAQVVRDHTLRLARKGRSIRPGLGRLCTGRSVHPESPRTAHPGEIND